MNILFSIICLKCNSNNIEIQTYHSSDWIFEDFDVGEVEVEIREANIYCKDCKNTYELNWSKFK